MTSPVHETDASTNRPRRTALYIAAVLCAALLLLGGVVVGRLTASTPPAAPTTTSAEAGFARDMQTHHQQAVRMSMIIRDSSDDPAIRGLAYDIATSQAQQSGQMFGWLSTWGLPQAAPEPSMTWMSRPTLAGETEGHGGSHEAGEGMPGLATSAQMEELEAAEGPKAEQLFLELMVAHHEGGVEMAEAVLARTEHPAVIALARGIVEAQQGEIDYMNELLATR